MKKNFLRCMAAVTALFAASCSSLPGLEGGADYEAQGEEVEVAFSISTETAYMATRAEADAGSGAAQPTIGKGLKINKLIYAVYDENYTLLKQYGDINDANGQKTILDPFGKDDDNRGIYKFSLRLMRGKVYRIAFWAQNHESNAYDTRDLTEVKVNYDAMQNNDEKNDVFCKVEVFSVSPVSTSRNVILTRPMAQINVGAQNWPSVGTSIAESEISLYSAITLENVATSINVVKDEIGRADATATFGWAQIPEQQYKDNSGNGEKLYIYSETIGSNGQPEVKEYDYLSMCYALVPAEKSASSDNNDSGDGEGTETASKDDKFTLKVSFSLSTDENGDSRIPLPEEGDNKETLTVDGAPAHRNWRTNILLGIGSKTRIPAEPDEPNVPDTPNTPDTPNKPDTPPGTDDPDPDPEPGPDTPPGTDDPEPGPDTPDDPEPGPTPPEEPKEDPEPGHVHITVVIDPRYDGSGNGSTTDDGKGYTGNPNKEKDC